MALHRKCLQKLRSHAAGLSARHMFAIAGMLFCVSILLGTIVLLERDRSVALQAEAERGKLLSNALESNVSRTLSAVDNTLDAVVHILESSISGRPANIRWSP